MSVIDEIKDESGRQGESLPRDTPAGIPDERTPDEQSDDPFVNVHGEAIVDCEEIVQFTFNGDWTEEQNIRGNGYGDDFFFVLDGATIDVEDNPEGTTLWKSTDDEANSADYKLVDMDNDEIEENAEKIDGDWEVTGVNIHGHTFYGERVDDFEEDQVLITVGSTAGQRLASVLDTLGGEAARYDEPEDEEDFDSRVDGLVEYPYGWWDSDTSAEDTGYPAIRRSPALRQDLVGEPVRFTFWMSDEEFHGNRQFQAGAVRLDDVGEMATTEEGKPDVLNKLYQDDEASAQPPYPSTIVWRTVENQLKAQQASTDEADLGGDPADAGADAEPEADDMTSEISALGNGDGDVDTVYEKFTQKYPVAQTIVDQVVDAGGLDALDKDLDAVRDDAVEADDMDDTVSTEDLRTAIEDRAVTA